MLTKMYERNIIFIVNQSLKVGESKHHSLEKMTLVLKNFLI